jgi:hypothetical protein
MTISDVDTLTSTDYMNVESEEKKPEISSRFNLRKNTKRNTIDEKKKKRERIKEAENFDKSLSSPDTLPTRYGDKRKFHLPLTKVEQQQCLILIMIYGEEKISRLKETLNNKHCY